MFLLWFVPSVILAGVLLVAVGCGGKAEGVMVCLLLAIVILAGCFYYIYSKGCKEREGYLVSPSRLSEDQEYEFFGQILTGKGYVVILEDDDLEIRCVLSRDRIPDGTKYLRKDSITESTSVEVKGTVLSPVDPEE